jgi:hypothetical protein
MNIRAREEHTYSSYESHSTSPGTFWCTYLSDCASGHTICLEYYTGVSALALSVTNVTRTTSRANLNIRSKTHTHNPYSGVTASFSTSLATYPAYALSVTCPAGHSGCVAFDSSTSQVLLLQGVTASKTTYSFPSWSPTAPLNPRTRIKHSHSLDKASITTDRKGVFYGNQTCPSGHENCAGAALIYSDYVVNPTYAGVTTSSNYE